jgi:murein DD-endopeptidase MepM/ murein hydrolase activator NlpD
MLLVLLFASGCATTAEHTTWDDDAREGVGSSVPRAPHRPVVVVPKLPIAIHGQVATEKREPVDSAAIELLILRFTSKRRALAREAPPSEGAWPRPIQASFFSILDELDRALESPKGSLPRRVLIQARVTMEVEVENSEGRFGPAPKEVTARVGKLFGAIALHMRAAPAREDRRAKMMEGSLALIWPVSPVIVTSGFGYRRDPILGRENVRFHAGVDLGGESGDVVHASAPGRVVGAGWLGGHGRAVVVQHAGGYQTMYAHLRQIVVELGAEVEAGSPVGLIGTSGRSTGPHLHFEVRRGGVPLDPLEALGPTFAFMN